MSGAEAKSGEAPSPSTRNWQTYPNLGLHPILQVALAEFQQRGYHGTTVRAIATGVGVQIPSLYYHYGSKEGILVALLNVGMSDLITHIQLALQDAEGDTTTMFENFITVNALHSTRRRDLARLHGQSRFLGPTYRAQYVARRTMVEDTLVGLLREGISEGIFADDDPRFTSRVLFGMLSGIHDWYGDNGTLTATEIADRYTELARRLVLRDASA